MKNTIAERVLEFLKKYPPFDIISKQDLLDIAKETVIVYLEKEQVLFDEDQPLHPHFYIVKEGAILLTETKNSQIELVDVCDEGELFGLRPLVAKDHYKMRAIANEESIVYAISVEAFKPILEKDKTVALYMVESFASKTKNPFAIDSSKNIFATPYDGLTQRNDRLFELQPIQFTKKTITATASHTVQQISQKMTKYSIGSMIITDEEQLPVGIITDKDIRKKIATGTYTPETTAGEIMISPVLTFTDKMSIAEAQLNMMKNDIRHLVLTKDGTPESPLIGILTEQDILVSQGNSVSGLMKAIKRARKSKHLRNIRQQVSQLLEGYIYQNIPMTLTSNIIHEINEAITVRAIEISLSRMDSKPPVSFAWMSLGSHGRGEQLLITDQDNALVFHDVDPKEYQVTKAYFLELAERVTKMLNKIGYEYCPADMMARNPKWCLSLSEWKDQFNHWIYKAGNEEILLCSIFFDFNCTYGDVTLVNELSSSIFSSTQNNDLFFAVLGRSALHSPSPLGFFRQFLVEQDGEHKDSFDIKSRAMMPLTDIGRVLILSHQVKHINNTAARFEKLADLEP